MIMMLKPIHFVTAAACGFGEKVALAYQRQEGPLQIHWFPKEMVPTEGLLGITITPGRKWRNMYADVSTLYHNKARRFVFSFPSFHLVLFISHIC